MKYMVYIFMANLFQTIGESPASGGSELSHAISQFIRDPVWQFIGVVLGLIAICITVVQYLKQRHRKSLSYRIMSHKNVLLLAKSIRDKHLVLFDGKPVKSVSSVIFKFFNSGNVPIQTNDYIKYIIVEFGEDCQVLHTEVIGTHPDNLEVTINIEHSSMTIIPSLLNPKDWIMISALVTSFKPSLLNIDARVIGIEEIKHFTPRYLGISLVILYGILMFPLGVLVKDVGPIQAGVVITFFGLMAFALLFTMSLIGWMLKPLKRSYAYKQASKFLKRVHRNLLFSMKEK